MQPSPLLYSVGLMGLSLVPTPCSLIAQIVSPRSLYAVRYLQSTTGDGWFPPAAWGIAHGLSVTRCAEVQEISVRLLVLLIVVRVDVPKRIFTMKKIVIAIATLLITIPAFAGPPPSRHHGHHVMQAQAHMRTGEGPTSMVRTPNHYPTPNEGVKLMDPDRVTW